MKKSLITKKIMSSTLLVFAHSLSTFAHSGLESSYSNLKTEIEIDSQFCDLNGDGIIDQSEVKNGLTYPCEKPLSISDLDDSGQFLMAPRGINVKLNRGELWLTIDDGPNRNVTPNILKLLRKYNIKATFFVIGKNIPGNEDILQEIIREGHTLANHSFSHNLPNITASTISKELESTHAAILKALGNSVNKNGTLLREIYTKRMLFRAPGLAWNTQKMDSVNRDKSRIAARYIGPVHANLGTDAPRADWSCWSKKVSESTCASYYYQDILKYGRGTILAHDISYTSAAPTRNTYGMLVILLKKLDEEAGGIANLRGSGSWKFINKVNAPEFDALDISGQKLAQDDVVDNDSVQTPTPTPKPAPAPVQSQPSVNVITKFSNTGVKVRTLTLSKYNVLDANAKSATDMGFTVADIKSVVDTKEDLKIKSSEGTIVVFKKVKITAMKTSGLNGVVGSFVYIWEKAF